MTAVARPELDLSRLRHAVERLDLPDLSELELPRVDLARVDLADLDKVFRRRGSAIPSGSLLVGGLALLGGLALGGLLAFFLNPSKGAKRRRQARRRLGRLKRRVLP